MAKQPSDSKVSMGLCEFCKGEFERSKMTRHLKSCKQRAASIATEEATGKPKTKLFHIVAQGHYNPQYWLHLELLASEPLDTLDYFLRGIWLEHFEHLSAFRIGNTSYSSEPPDFIFDNNQVTEEDEEEYSEEEDDTIDVEALLKAAPSEMVKVLSSGLLVELKKLSNVDEIIAFAREKLDSSSSFDLSPLLSFRSETGFGESRDVLMEAMMRTMGDKLFLQWVLDELVDTSMNVRLAKVLSVGKKFSYEYDFGSTTHIDLRVVSEREGVVDDEKYSVKLLARNVVPEIPCQVCGKPATQVVVGYYDADERGYCDKCARKHAKESEYADLISIANSPRVGVL